MVGLNVGELDREGTLQQLVESRGASGFPVETWATLDTVYAARRDMGGAERFRANQLSASSVTVWTIQYRADMDPELLDVAKQRRWVYLGRVFDITAPRQIGRQEGIEFTTLGNPAVTA